MKIRLVMSALLLTASSISQGQAVPAGIATVSPGPTALGPNLSPFDGVVHYALTASQIVQLGFYGPGALTSTTALSADVAYTAKSTALPFSMLFAGGVILPNQSGQGVSGFTNIAASQGYIRRGWMLNLSDSFSFLPQSPTTGLSGIPGIGDLGVIQGADGLAGGVLTLSGNRISNALNGTAQRQITQATSISGAGSWSILHFLDEAQGAGLDYSQISGVVALNRRLDARSSASVSAVYSIFNYSGPQAGLLEPDFQTRGINFSYQRTLNRSFSAGVSVGPQWISSSNSELIPSTVNVAVSANLNYSHRFTTAALSYTRGVNGGSGSLAGALSDSISASAARSYGRNWVASVNAAYTRSQGLTEIQLVDSFAPVNVVYETVYGGVQVTRRISTNLSGYATYTVENQTSNYSAGAQNAFTGSSQIFGAGITFSPRSTRLGQF